MTIYQNLIAGSGFLQGPKGDTGPAANTNITVYEYVATAGQTTFTGVDSNLQTLAYTPTGLIVTLNGSVLNDTTDYIANNGTSILLTQSAATGDELNAYTFPPFNVANTYTQAETSSLLNTKLNITGGTLTGNISFANGANLLVPVGNTAQRPAASPGYIRYNTDLNTLESANATAWANVGSGSASSGGATWQPVQNSNFIAVTGSAYLVNTYTGNVTVTLPASPTFGQELRFVDYGGYFSANGLIIYGNGNKILGNTANVTMTTNTASLLMVYTDNNKGWIPFSGFTSSPVGTYTVQALIIAGGGGSEGAISGGGGAGGLIYVSATPVIPGTSYLISVGGGGASSTSGTNSSGIGQTAVGGGRGGPGYGGNGFAGGSGGGGSRNAGSAGSGTAGQGNPGGGGSGNGGTDNLGSGGGGGGAGASGQGASGGTAGSGGIGSTYSISGASVYYAGGGGGGSYNGTAGTGGTGGGGPGTAGNTLATAGTNNTGGGAGAPGYNAGGQPGVAGGSGIVIISYLGGQRAVGGSVTQSGGYTIHTFTSSGTFVA